ncbi:MAG TPA: 6-phosphogluconolactonase, partial [Ktedonobacterales bacterium]|nr:6-phosphogluconolactonase [Ktedonobacterales bacterium]
MSAPAPSSPTIRVFDDLSALADAAAQLYVETATASVKAKGSFFVALSGGSTPRTLYTLLAQPPYHDQVNWSRARIFFGDERCVPPTDAESNYRMARESLLFHVPVSSH